MSKELLFKDGVKTAADPASGDIRDTLTEAKAVRKADPCKSKG